MRALKVYENFERGRNPLDALDIGIRDVKELGPLAERPVHVLKRDGRISISKGYLLWKLLNFIKEQNEKGESVGYTDAIKYYSAFRGEPWRRSFTEGQWNNIKKYIHRTEDRKYRLNPFGRSYLERYSFFDDGRQSLKESKSFERGSDPKQSLGVGIWRKGYKIEKDTPYEIPTGEYGYVRVDLSGEEWNFGKKVFDPDEIPQTPVDPDMVEEILKDLPVVLFKYYYETGNMTGLFGDWPEDFEYRRVPFIANVEEDEGRSFLIEPEGYTYPRYITELV